MPSPMPELAPVTSARCPSSVVSRMLILCSRVSHGTQVWFMEISFTGALLAEMAAADEVVDRELPGAVYQSHQQEQAPVLVIFQTYLAQVGIGHYRDDVEHEQHECRKTRSETEHQ